MKSGFFICFIFLTTIGTAQTFRTGLKAGGNLSYLGSRDSGNQSNTSRTGFHGGWIGSWDVSGFALQTEVVYSSQGGAIGIAGVNYEENYNYLNIPIGLKFDIGKNFSFHFGPYFSLLLNATQRETGQDDVDIDEFIASTDYGGFAGLGFDLQDSWLFEVRYNYGLTDVDQRNNFERRNRFWQLSASYFLKK